MKISQLLDEMENALLAAPRVPLTNRRIIEEDDMLRYIDELHDSLPTAIMEAERIMAERQRIMDEAHANAQVIIEQAKGYVARLTDENIITRQAQEQAAAIISQARQAGENLQQDAVAYAGEVFRHLENHIARTLEVVRHGHEELKPTNLNKPD